jgi:hypothetical protein
MHKNAEESTKDRRQEDCGAPIIRVLSAAVKHTAATWVALIFASGSLVAACAGNGDTEAALGTTGTGSSAGTGNSTGTAGGNDGTGGESSGSLASSTSSGSPETTSSTSSGGTGGSTSNACSGKLCNLDSDCVSQCGDAPNGDSFCCDTMTAMCFVSNTATCPEQTTTTGSTSSSSSGY